MKTNRSRQSTAAGQAHRFTLRNDFGFWDLTFGGRHDVIRAKLNALNDGGLTYAKVMENLRCLIPFPNFC